LLFLIVPKFRLILRFYYPAHLILGELTKELELDVASPRIGESFTLNIETFPQEMWWENFE
jgi:hypothetical protein